MDAGERSIPTTLAEITPAWLTAVLAEQFPGADVQSLTTETLHDGTTFTCRVYVTYRGGGNPGPATLCVKSGMDAPHRGFVFEAGLCCKEAMVYRDLLPLTSARVAKCYATGFETASGKGYVVLEDLDVIGAKFCSAENPLSPEQVADGLEQLSELHSVFWNDPRITEPRWRHRGQSLSEPDKWERYFLAPWQGILQQSHAGAIPRLFHRADIVGPAMARLRKLDDASASCLIHGDAHIGNFFVNGGGRPCMADFQVVQRGDFTHDVAMFIASSLDILDRRSHERDLIQAYLTALARRIGTAPSFDETWLGYRRHVLYGMLGWLLTTDVFQTQLRCVTTVYRFGSAALDLNSLEAIGQ